MNMSKLMQNTGPDLLQTRKLVHVAVAVIYGADGRILLARRPEGKHQGGLWEFPGGKVESGESVRSALQRELQEEVAIQVSEFKPLIRIRHDYSDKSVLLDTWEVSGITGEARGNEGQSIQWVAPERLQEFCFPEANRPIVQAVQLPDRYMITGLFDNEDELFDKVLIQLQQGVQLVQFRAPWLTGHAYLSLAKKLSQLVRNQGGRLILKGSAILLQEAWCDGLHLTSEQLISGERFVKYRDDQLLMASCHNPMELSRAQEAGLDSVTLSPVKLTRSHPAAEPLGIECAAKLTEFLALPVYWLGGLTIKDIGRVKSAGAQGVAAISEFWR